MLKKNALKILLILTLCSFPASAYANPTDVPDVTTLESSVSGGSIELFGQTTSLGVTEYGFEYGKTISYGERIGSSSAFEDLSIGNTINPEDLYGSGNGQFSHITGVATNSFGEIFSVDADNYRVQKFNSQGDFVSNIGSQGSGDGQFSWSLAGIAIDSNDNILVVDSSNGRVQKFDRDGEFLSKFGSGGADEGQFSGPSGIALDGDSNIYVVDSGNNRVQKFDSNGNFLSAFGQDQLDKNPKTIAVSPNGSIYVGEHTTYGNGQIDIEKFNSNFEHVLTISLEQVWGGHFGLTVDGNDQLYVGVNGGSDIRTFDSDGNFLETIGRDLIQDYGSSGYQKPIYFNQSENSIYLGSGRRIFEILLSDPAEPLYSLNVTLPTDCGSTYHFRAFATNSAGTSYGQDQTFVNSDCEESPFETTGNTTARTAEINWDATSSYNWYLAYRPMNSNQWTAIRNHQEDSDLGLVFDLEPATQYVFRVAPISSSGEDYVITGQWSETLVLETKVAQNYEITTCQDLQAIGFNPLTQTQGDLEGNYILTRDLDCSETRNWHEDGYKVVLEGLQFEYYGFLPISGNQDNSNSMMHMAFSGTFDGRGHSISNIYQKAKAYSMGFFGLTYGASISNLTLNNLEIEVSKSEGFIGGLAGMAINTTIDNVHVNGSMVSVEGGINKYVPNGSLEKSVIKGNLIYVSEYGTIAELSPVGELVKKLEDISMASGEFEVDSNGNIFTVSENRNEVVKYNSQGNELDRFGYDDARSIYRIQITNSDSVYVNTSNGVEIYDVDGELQESIALDLESTSSQQNFAVDSQSRFYIGINSNVFKFDADGELLQEIGQGLFQYNPFVEIDSSDNIVVLDRNTRNIWTFDSEGVLINTFNVNPSESDENFVDGHPFVYDPIAMSIDDDGSFYINNSNRYLGRYSSTGQYQDSLTTESLNIFTVGGIAGSAIAGEDYSYSTSISRSSTDIDMNFNSKSSDMITVSGIAGYGKIDISDSFATGDINFDTEDTEVVIISGITSYNITGKIDRTYYAGNISGVGINSIVGGSGIASYSMGVELNDNFFSGNIDLESMMPFNFGIGGYLADFELENNEGTVEVKLSNNAFDQTAARTDQCVWAIDADEQTKTFENDPCRYVNVDGNDSNYFLGNSSAEFFNNWDFEDVWQVNDGALPTLRPLTLSEEIPDDDDSDADSPDVNGNIPLVTDIPGPKIEVVPQPSKFPGLQIDDGKLNGPEIKVEGIDKTLVNPFEETNSDGNSAVSEISENKSSSPFRSPLLVVSTLISFMTAIGFSIWCMKLRGATILSSEELKQFQGWK